jgi:hypothetical protein
VIMPEQSHFFTEWSLRLEHSLKPPCLCFQALFGFFSASFLAKYSLRIFLIGGIFDILFDLSHRHELLADVRHCMFHICPFWYGESVL